jgi:hypothetical protein
MEQNEGMTPEELNFVLESSRENARFTLSGLDLARSRAHALLLLLMTGGAGMGSLGLARWGDVPYFSVVMLASALWWFAWAAWVAWRALTSSSVRSWSPGHLLQTHEDWCRYRGELLSEGQLAQANSVVVFDKLKLDAIHAANLARQEYAVASAKAFAAVDLAYKAVACTPLLAGLVGLVWGFYR